MLERIGSVDGLKVLEIGCGDGALAVTLATLGAWVTGLDPSPAMRAAARTRADRAGVSLVLVDGEARHLPFEDDQFDLVVSVAALCFCPDASAPIGEMKRCLRPGGRLVLGELGKWTIWSAIRRFKAMLGSPLWRTARFRSVAQLRALALGAGFGRVEVAGAIFYPPFGLLARLLGPVDPMIGRLTCAGAAFLVLSAIKPPAE